MQLVCNIIRGKEVESNHTVYAVVIDENKKIIFSVGNPEYITCIRSSLKPFQASTLIKYKGHKKFNLTSEELSLVCASHSAEKTHTDTVLSILKKINCNINDLECGPHPAYDLHTRHMMLKQNIPFSSLHNNCSGKHVGMLALAKTLNIDYRGYINSNHIIQKKIFSNILQYAGTQPHNISIDGCSVPTPFYSLYTIAQMYLQLINNQSTELKILYDSMIQYPHMVAGQNRFDTDFMFATNANGVSKGGGEAIQGLAMKTKKYGMISMALKVLSGSHLVRDVAIMKVLNHLNCLSDKENKLLEKYIEKPINNHNGLQTGVISAELLT